MAVTTLSTFNPGRSKRLRNRKRRFYVRRQRRADVRLDLGPIREELGDKWTKVDASVRRYALHVITHHVRDRGRVTQQGDVFWVRLVGMDRQAANKQLERIEQDLYRLLFGSKDAAQTALARRRGAGRGAHRRRGRGLFSRWMSKFNNLFRSNSQDVESEGTGTSSDADRVAEVPFIESAADGSSRHSTSARSATPQTGKSEKNWWSANRTGGNQPAGGRRQRETNRNRQSSSRRHHAMLDDKGLDIECFDPKRDGSGDAFTPGSSQTPGRVRGAKTNALERALHNAILEAERQNELAKQVRTFPPLGMRFLYRGLWRVEKGIMPIYTCLPACSVGPFEFLTGEALIQGNIPVTLLARLDEMLLHHVIKDLVQQDPRSVGSIICAPVHYENLARDGGESYVKLLQDLPAALRGRLVIEIVNLSQGVGQSSTLGAVNRLRPNCYAILGRLNLGEQNFKTWQELDLFAVGVDIEAYIREEVLAIAEIDRFFQDAERAGLRTYVRGIQSRSLAAAVSTNGVHFIEGPAIDEGGLDFQAAPIPFGVTNIYSEV